MVLFIILLRGFQVLLRRLAGYSKPVIHSRRVVFAYLRLNSGVIARLLKTDAASIEADRFAFDVWTAERRGQAT